MPCVALSDKVEENKTLARNEEQAISKEDAMRKEFEELERRNHETTARSSDAWVVVERSLNFELRSLGKGRTPQTLYKINVLEAQVT
ncbi:hypothetical protein Dimus_002895 [Dionaea muscipula]